MSVPAPVLIRDRQILIDDYLPLADDAPIPAAGRFIVSWERWQQQADALKAAPAPIGVQIPNTLDLENACHDLQERPLIVLSFPSFGDGRAYSQARLLRTRYGFQGELRASGAAVVRDQLHGMMRSGINSFSLRPDQDPQSCLRAFDDFDAAYQPASDGVPSVLERRRRAAI